MLSRFLALLLVLVFAIGCGSKSDDSATAERPEVRLVYVSWVEGIAMTHVLHVLMEDSLGVDAPMTQAGGAAFAFGALATDDADVFVDAWLPTTHGALWDRYGEDLEDWGAVYDSTTVGLVVPADADLQHVRDLAGRREALGGEIIGIESGAAINEQTRTVLAEVGLADAFDVVASSDAAMVSALRRAVDRGEPIVITGWKPHWMWGRFDLRYLAGAQTGQSDVFGAPETIHKLTRTGARQALPERVVRLLDRFHLDDPTMTSLVTAFRPGYDDPDAAARRWIANHPATVKEWLEGND